METPATRGGIDVTDAAGTGRPDIEVRHDEAPVIVRDRKRRSLRTTVLVVGIVVLLLVGLATAWVLRGGGDDRVGTTAAAGAERAAPAALAVQVDPPRTAVAGEPATLVVHYADGLGVFSGSQEDWGDGVGAGSASQGRCGRTTTGPANGSYRARHTWAEPGRYLVAIEVTTYTCVAGKAVEEHASTTVDVTVTAP